MRNKDITNLTKDYFSFLIDYGFTYDQKQNIFTNGEISIYISRVEKILPKIEVWLQSEPEFTRIELEWLLEEQIDYKSIDKNLLEDNFIYYATLLRQNMRLLTGDLMSLLLSGLKKLFINIAKAGIRPEESAIDNYLNDLPSMDKEYYDYIKERDPDWDPGKELRALFG